MATPIGAKVLYKTNTGWVTAHILRAYSDAGVTPVDNVAETDASVTNADLLVLGLQPVRLAAVPKEVTVCGNDGVIAAGSNAATTAASMATGHWFNFS